MAEIGEAAAAKGLQVFTGNEEARNIYVLLNIRGDELAAVLDEVAGIDVTWASIEGKPATFPPSAHSHSWDAISGKPTLVSLAYFDGRLDIGGNAPIYSTHGRANPVASSWVAAALDSQGRIAIQPSSLRFKNDLGAYDGSVLDLQPVVYTLIGDDEQIERVGFFAEQVEGVEPRAVVLDDEGAPLALDHNAITAALLRDVQRLAARVDELERRAA